MSVIKIGRHPSNHVVLSYPQVSSHHARLTIISPNSGLLEDTNSANGTFVNEVRVKRCIIGPADVVKAANVKLDLSAHFAGTSPQPPTSPQADPLDFSEPFAQLADVYAQYEQTRRQIRNGVLIRQTAIRAGLALIPFIGNAIAIAVCAGITDEEKLMALDKEFKINYVCPNCKNFLGYLPFEAVAARKKCYCKAVWVK